MKWNGLKMLETKEAQNCRDPFLRFYRERELDKTFVKVHETEICKGNKNP